MRLTFLYLCDDIFPVPAYLQDILVGYVFQQVQQVRELELVIQNIPLLHPEIKQYEQHPILLKERAFFPRFLNHLVIIDHREYQTLLGDIHLLRMLFERIRLQLHSRDVEIRFSPAVRLHTENEFFHELAEESLPVRSVGAQSSFCFRYVRSRHDIAQRFIQYLLRLSDNVLFCPVLPSHISIHINYFPFIFRHYHMINECDSKNFSGMDKPLRYFRILRRWLEIS